MDYKIIADALTKAAMQTDYEVSISRTNSDITVGFVKMTSQDNFVSEVYGMSKFFGYNIEYRMCSNGTHITLDRNEFLTKVQKWFKEFGVDFLALMERIA